jgi:STE24 endopeptidase
MPRLAAASADVAPVVRGRLAARLQRLADRAGVAGFDVLEWKVAGRQSAVLVGAGDQQRVLLTTGLLETHAEEEIEVVVAHELAHLRRHDTWRSALLVSAVAAVALYAAARALTALGPALSLGTATDSRVLSLVGLVVFAVHWVAMPVVTAQSRAQERQADRVALGWTQNPPALVRSLRRLSAAHLSEERPSLVTQAFFGSHPSVVERIEAAEAWHSSRSGAGG